MEEKLKQAEERLNAQDAEIEMLKKFTAFLPNTCKKANKFVVINEFINTDSYLNLTRTQLVKLLCSYLTVSVSGFYRYLKTNKILLNDETMMQTDQGSHYTSPQFGNLLNELEITHSMSRRGKCTDNAPIDSFFGHFKCEVAYEDCKNLEELKSIVDEYMLYYNCERLQMDKQKMTPHQVECHFLFA